jgi:hypothetical protein
MHKNRITGYKIFLIVWLTSWLACFSYLCLYLYRGGDLSLFIWIAFLGLGLTSPDFSIIKEIWGKPEMGKLE